MRRTGALGIQCPGLVRIARGIENPESDSPGLSSSIVPDYGHPEPDSLIVPDYRLDPANTAIARLDRPRRADRPPPSRRVRSPRG